MKQTCNNIMNPSIESFGIQNLYANEIKNQILREGIWEPYTQRIKNLEKVQEKFWEIYDSDCDVNNKRKILEDIVNLQPVISNWYSSSLKVLELEGNCGVSR